MMIRPHLFPDQIRRIAIALMVPATIVGGIATPSQLQSASAQQKQQSGGGQAQPLYINCKIQQYDAKSQVATCLKDVEMLYPSRGIKATAAQAQYFFNEGQIVLTGNAYVLQQGGNSIRAETVTYLVNEGKFIAQPQSGRQVESVYMVREGQIPQSGANR